MIVIIIVLMMVVRLNGARSPVLAVGVEWFRSDGIGRTVLHKYYKNRLQAVYSGRIGGVSANEISKEGLHEIDGILTIYIGFDIVGNKEGQDCEAYCTNSVFSIGLVSSTGKRFCKSFQCPNEVSYLIAESFAVDLKKYLTSQSNPNLIKSLRRNNYKLRLMDNRLPDLTVSVCRANENKLHEFIQPEWPYTRTESSFFSSRLYHRINGIACYLRDSTNLAIIRDSSCNKITETFNGIGTIRFGDLSYLGKYDECITSYRKDVEMIQHRVSNCGFLMYYRSTLCSLYSGKNDMSLPYIFDVNLRNGTIFYAVNNRGISIINGNISFQAPLMIPYMKYSLKSNESDNIWTNTVELLQEASQLVDKVSLEDKLSFEDNMIAAKENRKDYYAVANFSSSESRKVTGIKDQVEHLENIVSLELDDIYGSINESLKKNHHDINVMNVNVSSQFLRHLHFLARMLNYNVSEFAKLYNASREKSSRNTSLIAELILEMDKRISNDSRRIRSYKLYIESILQQSFSLKRNRLLFIFPAVILVLLMYSIFLLFRTSKSRKNYRVKRNLMREIQRNMYELSQMG